MTPYSAPGIIDIMPTLENLLILSASAFDVDPTEMKTKSRETSVLFARYAYCYLARKKTDLSFAKIGQPINRDHSTVLMAVKTAETLLETNHKYFKRQTKNILNHED